MLSNLYSEHITTQCVVHIEMQLWQYQLYSQYTSHVTREGSPHMMIIVFLVIIIITMKHLVQKASAYV